MIILLLIVIILIISKTLRNCLGQVLAGIALIVWLFIWQLGSCNEPNTNDHNYKEAVQRTKELTGVDLSDTTRQQSDSSQIVLPESD